MKTSRLTIALLSLLVASSVVMAGNGPGADPTQEFNIGGPVVEFTVASGSGMPMLTVEDATLGVVDVALGPVWFIQQSEFSVSAGESVDILAYGCTTCAASYVAAWVVNNDTGSSIELRNEDGRPLWTQRQRGGSDRPGQGNGSGGQNGDGQGGGQGGEPGDGNGEPGDGNGEPGDGNGSGPGNGSGLDMSQIATVTGEVVDFTGHAGSGQPVLTLDFEGDIYEITVSPYGPIEAAGLVIEPGLILEVVFAPTECEEGAHLVTISILDVATGLAIQLRDSETGFPMSNGNGQNRPDRP